MQERNFGHLNQGVFASKKIVSYCIPVKGRPEELEITLKENIAANRAFQDLIEFIVLSYDNDSALLDKLSETYREEIEAGYLILRQLQGLDKWHPGKVKNGFKNILRGEIYSSLDVGHFVMDGETSLLLRLHDIYGGQFIHYGFTGSWGDGSIRRLSLNSKLYKSIGYDQTFMPADGDLDVVLSILEKNPNIPIITHCGGEIFSDDAKAYLKSEGLKPNLVEITRPSYKAPLDSKCDNYTEENHLSALMAKFNMNISFAKNTHNIQRKEEYYISAAFFANEIIDRLDAEEVTELFFGNRLKKETVANSRTVNVFSCVKDDDLYLDKWLDHYRSLGCNRFFIVDDSSKKPIARRKDLANAIVVIPQIGTFRSCKVIWIRALMKAFLTKDDWVVTVDADEFIDIPKYKGGEIWSVIKRAEKKNQQFIPGLLVDMMPRKKAINKEVDFSNFTSIFDHHFMALDRLDNTYSQSSGVSWAFGDYWKISRAVDVRYELFGTIDVLRKIPVFKFSPAIRLNQGFHEIVISGRSFSAHEAWLQKEIVFIKHYKFVRLLSSLHKEVLRERIESLAYHSTTNANIRSMLNVEDVALVVQIQNLNLIKFSDSTLQKLLPGRVPPSSAKKLSQLMKSVIGKLVRKSAIS